MTFGQNKRYYTESSMKLSDPGALTVEYTRYMTLGIAYPPKVERILEIGLGGGRTVSYLSASLPDTGILAVELDKDVVDLAKKYFKFKETARLRTVVSDGRTYLAARQREVGRDPDRRLSRAVRAVSPADQGVLHAGQVAAQRRAAWWCRTSSRPPCCSIRPPPPSSSVFPSVDLYDGGGNVVAVGYEGPSLRQAELAGARRQGAGDATSCATICAPWPPSAACSAGQAARS